MTFRWLMVYKVLSCSQNILRDLIRWLTYRKCGLIDIKQRKRYLHADLSNVGQCNRLKENWKEKKKANGLTHKLPWTHRHSSHLQRNENVT